jgi:hypothetical protein
MPPKAPDKQPMGRRRPQKHRKPAEPNSGTQNLAKPGDALAMLKLSKQEETPAMNRLTKPVFNTAMYRLIENENTEETNRLSKPVFNTAMNGLAELGSPPAMLRLIENENIEETNEDLNEIEMKNV